jgi:hypothetical protein
MLQAGVTFGASPTGTFRTFNNAAGLNNTTISELSAVGVNGAFVAAGSANEVGSPGTVGKLFISEVAPWASGNSPVGADWFEVTNTTAHAVDISGWKMDDNSNSFAAAVALNGITSIAPGESVIFIETTDLPGKAGAFASTWFGTTPPTTLQIGSYSGGSVGLSGTADAVNLFDGAGLLKARVTFGASPTGPTFATFDNAAALNNGTISRLSAAGIDGAFVAVNDSNEIGSPGTIDNDPPAAAPDTVSTPEDTSVSFDVLANDSDPDGDPLAIVGFTAAGHGTVARDGDGGFTYTPAPDFNGSDAFTYTVTDGNGRTATTTVSIAVTAVNDAPVLSVPAGQTTAEDVPVAITGITVADLDAGEGTGQVRVTLSVGSGTLTVAAAVDGGLTGAQIIGNGGRSVVLEGPITAVNATLTAGVTYLGDLNFNGTDVLTVVADDLGNTGTEAALTDSATVAIRVASPAEQIGVLESMVETLYAQFALNSGQANSLLNKLEQAEALSSLGQWKVAYNAIHAFKNKVQSFVSTEVLTPVQGQPLLSAADLLLQSLLIGGGF